MFFVKYYAPISISSLNAAPPPDVAQDKFPEPSVDNDCPAENRKSAVAAGKWMVEKGFVNSPGYGRNRINAMLSTGLLRRDGIKGPLIAGPKLLY